MFKTLESKILGVLLVIALVICGTIGFLYKQETNKTASLTNELNYTKVALGIAQAKLLMKPKIIVSRSNTNTTKTVDTNGKVIESFTTVVASDEAIIITPNEIIREITKEAPVKRWLFSMSVPVGSLSINSVGVAYQPFKRMDLYFGGLYLIDDNKLHFNVIYRF